MYFVHCKDRYLLFFYNGNVADINSCLVITNGADQPVKGGSKLISLQNGALLVAAVGRR